MPSDITNLANDNSAIPPSIMSHVSIGVADMERATAFYDAVMGALGYRQVMAHKDVAVAYGTRFPEFWVQLPHNKKKAGPAANGTHFAFTASSKEAVDAFHAAALANGGTDDGAPGFRPEYGEPYYGAFVHDPDGHKIEAMIWDGPLSGS